MLIRSLLFAVPTILFAHIALAQQIYKWQDEKGQWHYSHVPPAGVKAEKVETGDAAQKPDPQPPVTSIGEEKKAEDTPERPAHSASDVDPRGSAGRRLLVFPPSDIGKPFFEWMPVASFDSVEECDRAKASEIAGSTRLIFERPTVLSDIVDFGALNSRCISLAEFKPSKQANVIVTVATVGQDQSGFSTLVLSGRVFNRGQTTARNVVVKYHVRDTSGAVYAEGEIPTTPNDVPPTMFGEFRGQIVGATELSGRSVHTETNWSKD